MERAYNHCILNEIAKKYNNLVSALQNQRKIYQTKLIQFSDRSVPSSILSFVIQKIPNYKINLLLL